MEEIIGSLKDIKLKNFALGLQEKLNEAKIAIVQKKKRGQEVSAKESAELKKSVAGYTEKNRHSIPQKVAVLLAATMLTSMLASCDNQKVQVEAGETTEIEDTFAYPEDLEIPDFIEGFDEDKYGFGVPFSKIDFNEWIRDGKGSAGFEELEEDFGQYATYKDLERHSQRADYVRYRNGLTLAGLDKENKRRNVAFTLKMDLEEDSYGWSHTFVSTSDDFAVVSKDQEGNFYVTGLIDGEIRSDAGFMDEETFKYTYRLISENGYDGALNKIREEFFGIIASISAECSSNFKRKVACLTNYGYIYKTNQYEVDRLEMYPMMGGLQNSSVMHTFYDVPENCVDLIVSGDLKLEIAEEDEYFDEDNQTTESETEVE